MKKAQSFNDIEIAKITKITDNKPSVKNTEDSSILSTIDVLEATSTYNVFILLYGFLKAKKIGQARQGGWISSGIKIKQRGENYELDYKGTVYNITKDCVYDFSNIILEHIA